MGLIKRFAQFFRGQRVEQPDLQFATTDAQVMSQLQLNESVILGEDNADANVSPTAWVLRGFYPTTPGAKILTIGHATPANGGGVAILRYKDVDGVLRSGLLVAAPEAKSEDLATLPVGTYGIYIRGEIRPEDGRNRFFWNSAAPTPVEYVRNVPVRRTEDWSFTVEAVSPGDEWFKIGDVTVGPTTISPSAVRGLMFEGQEANNYEVTDDEWGGGDDRDNAREANGAFGLYRAIRGLQRQVQDLVGQNAGMRRWWYDVNSGNANGVGPRSVTQLNNEKLARNGSQGMQGDLLPDGGSTYNLGSALVRWLALRADSVVLGSGAALTAIAGTGGGNAILSTGGGAGAGWVNNCPGAPLTVDGNITSVSGQINAQTGLSTATGNIVATAGAVQGQTNVVATAGDLLAPAGAVSVQGAATADRFVQSPVNPYTKWIHGAAAIVAAQSTNLIVNPGLGKVSSAVAEEAYWDIHLPQNATITAIEALYTAANGDLLLQVSRVDASNVATGLRSPASYSLPANTAPTLVTYVSGGSVVNPIVNNDLYRYRIYGLLGFGGGATDVFGFKVSYTLGELASA